MEELSYGAKLAWRNSNRIGRLFWDSLNVEDARNVDNERDFIDTINHHLEHATNNGKIKPYITIFHLIKHLVSIIINLLDIFGYEHAGDPSEREITQLAEHLGWKGKGTDFDVLPLIYQLPNDSIKWYELPNELIKEVEIEHEHYPKLKDLNLKWYGVPIISNMDLKIGGITYPTAPFNGWYMVTEIAVRNFTDSYRYNLLESIAEAFEFGTLKIILLIKIEHSLNLIMRYTIHLNLKVFLLLIT